MTLSVSAANTRATVSQVTAAPKNHRSAIRVTPSRVEFIYTPDIRRFDCTFNDLDAARSRWPDASPGEFVDDLDSSPSPRLRPLSRRGPNRSAAGVKISHNGQYVTLELRRRYNMSHWRRWRAPWHAGCLYNNQERQTGLGKKQAS